MGSEMSRRRRGEHPVPLVELGLKAKINERTKERPGEPRIGQCHPPALGVARHQGQATEVFPGRPERSANLDLGPTPAMGQGFGLGFAVRTEAGQNPLPGSTGSFYWTGAYGTTFFVDPKQQLIIIMMIQVPLSAGPFYRHEVRYLAYQALSPPD